MARPLYGIPVETLLEERRKAQDQLLKGSVLTSFGNDTGNSSAQIISHVRQRIAEINAELAARGHPDADPEITDPRTFVSVGFN